MRRRPLRGRRGGGGPRMCGAPDPLTAAPETEGKALGGREYVPERAEGASCRSSRSPPMRSPPASTKPSGRSLRRRPPSPTGSWRRGKRVENAHFRRRRRRRDSGVLADRRRCFSVHSSFPFILIVFLPLLPITWFSPRCWPLPTPAANQMRRHEAGEDPRWVLRPFSIGFFSWPIIGARMSSAWSEKWAWTVGGGRWG